MIQPVKGDCRSRLGSNTLTDPAKSVERVREVVNTNFGIGEFGPTYSNCMTNPEPLQAQLTYKETTTRQQWLRSSPSIS